MLNKVSKHWFSFFIAFIIIYRLFICFSFKHELINGESNNIWNAINVSQGKDLYTNPEDLPLEVFQYTPLSQLPIIFFARLIPSNQMYYVYTIWVLGRIMQLIYNLATIFLIYKVLTRCFKVSKIVSQASILFFFGGLTHLAFAVRPDSLQTLLVVSVYSFFCFGYFFNNNKRIIISSLLVGLAILAKQDGFLIVGPIALFLLFSKLWKQFFVYSLLSIISILLALVIANYFFGDYFLYSITKGIQNEPSFNQVLATFKKLFSLYSIQLGIVFSVIFYYLFSKKKMEDSVQLLFITVVCYFFFGLLTSSKLGSWINYYSLFFVFSFMLVGVFIDNYSTIRWINPLVYQLTISILVIVFLFRQIYHYTSPYLRFEENKMYYISKYEEVEKIKNKIHIEPETNILFMNQLQRNFLAANTIMVNIEYYCISNFDYTEFKDKNPKNVQYLIKNIGEPKVVESLCKFFKIDTLNYTEIYSDKSIQIYKSN